MKKNASKPKIAIPLNDIQEEFKVQLGFLRSSCESFDSGNTDEFRRIALCARILVHDKGDSVSLATQLEMKQIFFCSFSAQINPRNLVVSHPLVILRSSREDSSYKPILNDSPFPIRFQLFDDWWSEEVYRSPRGLALTRKDFVLTVANQMGGAHVDEEINADFFKLVKCNETGWWRETAGHNISAVEGLVPAYIRQIGFELYETLAPEWGRIIGNRYCDCGSGRKFRYCHGKQR